MSSLSHFLELFCCSYNTQNICLHCTAVLLCRIRNSSCEKISWSASAITACLQQTILATCFEVDILHEIFTCLGSFTTLSKSLIFKGKHRSNSATRTFGILLLQLFPFDLFGHKRFKVASLVTILN